MLWYKILFDNKKGYKVNEIMSIENYTNTYRGRNYAEYPISINNSQLFQIKLWLSIIPLFILFI